VGDKWGISTSLHSLGSVAFIQGDYATIRALVEESLSLRREMGDKAGISASLGTLGAVANIQGDYPAARALFEESLALDREIGDKWGISVWLFNLGNVAMELADYTTARAMFEESLAYCKEIDEKTHMAYVLLGLGLVDLAENNANAREHILHSLRLRQKTGEQLQQTSSLVGVAGLAVHDGNAVQAAQVLGVVDSTLKVLNAVVEIDVKNYHTQTLATVRAQLGEAAFRSAWEQGAMWTLEETVAKVLDEGGDP
jgi:tetratricopeptide (TPR) repeat protein